MKVVERESVEGFERIRAIVEEVKQDQREDQGYQLE